MSLVTYRSIGRLGNQIFQLSASIGYAKKHGMRWAAPSNTRETPAFHQYFPGLPKTGGQSGRRYEAHDPSMFGYREIPHFPEGITMVGFFQSLKYFENAQDEVRQALNLKYAEGYEDYVSIHVRRGDYVQNANSFPPITEDYIDSALAQIKRSGTDFTKVIFFSDDIQWCIDKFPSLGRVTCHYSKGRSEYEDLCLMASCGHHVIANSTFSWWGAWLGRNPNKIVVSPHHTSWFGPNGPTDTKDLIPDSWHQIKFR